MLIRLMAHHINNPSGVDKLIVIKGLPEEWMFRNGPEGKELIKPWQPDIDVNIPKDIRHLCTPTEITFRFSPIEKGGPWVVYKQTILGVRLPFDSEPGRDMWDKISRYIEVSTPRDQRVPVPVLVAKDHKSPIFETFTPKKRETGGLELTPSDIPVIDLSPKVEPIIKSETITVSSQIPVELEIKTNGLACSECAFISKSPNGLRIHKGKHEREKVNA